MILIDFAEAREILDASGKPTVEVTIHLDDGMTASASIGTGLSISPQEDYELRDADLSRFFGTGVQHAVKNVNEVISPRLKKMNPLEQTNIDKLLRSLDQTPNMAHIGSNATMAVSLACAIAAAKSVKKKNWEHLNDLLGKIYAKNIYDEEAVLPDEKMKPSLPTPVFTIFSGGRHSQATKTYQDIMLIPNTQTSVAEQLRVGAEIFHEVQQLLIKQGLFFAFGVSGGINIDIDDSKTLLDILIKAIKQTGHRPKEDVTIAIDVAAETIEPFSPAGYVANYKQEVPNYPIAFYEDPLQLLNLEPWKHLRAILHQFDTKVAMEDAISTHDARLIEAIKEKSFDLVVLSLGHIGTLTQLLTTAKVAKHHGAQIILGNRSCETTDTVATDLSVAIGARYLKAGGLSRGEHVSKYNRLAKIVDEGNWLYS